MLCWMGEPTKLVLLEKIIELIKRENLVTKAQEIGQKLLAGLRNLEASYPNLIMNSRGLGTLCSFDMPDSATRDRFIEMAITKGLHIGGCGEATIRFRPALIFTDKHLAITLDLLAAALKEMK